VAGTKKVLAAVETGRTAMIVNTTEFLPGDFTRNADFKLPTERLKRAIQSSAGRGRAHFVDASRLAAALFGSSLGQNIFLVGYAYQLGVIPLAAASIEQAIEMNGQAVAMNKAAFAWGRRAAIDPAAVEALAKPEPTAEDPNRRLSETFEETVARRAAFLTDYQDDAYAKRYRAIVERVRRAESEKTPGQTGLAEAAARYLFKLMAYKDEYEVARLYSDGSFLRQLRNEIGGEKLRLEFHLASPVFARRDKSTGLPRKMAFGPWMMTAFGILARFKRLRGTAFDPFGYSRERRTERGLIADYEATLNELMARLSPENHALAVGIAAIPEKIRGFGHVKASHLAVAKADEAALLERFRASAPDMLKAAE